VGCDHLRIFVSFVLSLGADIILFVGLSGYALLNA
jgi:hypothetical protein